MLNKRQVDVLHNIKRKRVKGEWRAHFFPHILMSSY
jgi:hypothetical protein